MDGLKMAQLATLIAMMGQGPASRDPNTKAMNESLIGSGQSATQAEARKKAAKDAKKDKGIGKALGAAGAIAAAPFTGGASLSYLPMAVSAGGVMDSALMGNTQGATQNAMDVGMGYMMAKSMPKKEKATPVLGVPKDHLEEFDPGLGAKSDIPSAVTETQGSPDPMATPSMEVKSLAPPPPTSPAGGGKNSPVGPNSMASLAKPAIIGLTGATAQRMASNRRAAAAGPPRPDAASGGAANRVGLAAQPNAATMTPMQIRGSSEREKLLMEPSANGMHGSGTLTKVQARSLGMSPEAIAEGIRSGRIIDDGSAGDFLKTAGGMLALTKLMQA